MGGVHPGVDPTGSEDAMRVPDGRTKMIAGMMSVAAVGFLAATVARSAGGTVRAEIPAGTRLVGALEETVSTARTEPGDLVRLRTVKPLELVDGVTVPEGIVIEGEVVRARGGGRLAGAPALTIRFTTLSLEGQRQEIAADPLRVRGKDDLGQSAALIGGGAVIGGVVGALAGNTTAGVAAGAVIGTGTAVATRGDQIVLPAGQKLRVRLAQPVNVQFKPRDRDRES
jgi:hypothetical protein